MTSLFSDVCYFGLGLWVRRVTPTGASRITELWIEVGNDHLYLFGDDVIRYTGSYDSGWKESHWSVSDAR
jgi:hypothetical protein